MLTLRIMMDVCSGSSEPQRAAIPNKLPWRQPKGTRVGDGDSLKLADHYNKGAQVNSGVC